MPTPNSKHIDVRHHFLRERVALGEFEVVDVSSALQHTDFLMKPLHTEAIRFQNNFVTISVIYILVSDSLGYWVMITEKRYLRELEKVSGCTGALSNVNTPIENADVLDEPCRTRWLLDRYAHRAGDLKLLLIVSIVLKNFRCSILLNSAYSRNEHLLIAGGLL